jgi:hypothetical protein
MMLCIHMLLQSLSSKPCFQHSICYQLHNFYRDCHQPYSKRSECYSRHQFRYILGRLDLQRHSIIFGRNSKQMVSNSPDIQYLQPGSKSIDHYSRHLVTNNFYILYYLQRSKLSGYCSRYLYLYMFDNLRQQLHNKYFEHRSICWFQCIQCSQLCSHHNNNFELHSNSLFPKHTAGRQYWLGSSKLL